jgi:tetratricopeptide (TPR) repeat protein
LNARANRILCRSISVAIFVLAASSADAATLKGVIRANEMRGEPMANVPVAADGSNPTTSDSFGKFTLEFPRKNPGDAVEVIPKREGYLAVNDVQLELALPADSDAKTLTIILCRKEVREEMARRYYRLKSFDAIEESYQKRQKELEDTQQATAVALTKLQQEREQAKAAAGKASEELAKDEPGRTSELYRQAKRLFLEGKVAEAITLLDDEKLRQSTAQAKKDLDDAVQGWLFKGQLLTVQLRFEEAEKAYLQAIDAAPDSFKANLAYARFNYELGRLEEARAGYDLCLEVAKKNLNKAELKAERAATLNDLGILDRSRTRVDEARQELEEALQIRRELAQESPEVYLADVALTLNNLAVLNSNQGRVDQARQELEEVLQIRRELAQESPEVYLPDVALTLNNLAVLNSNQGRVENARQELEETLQIRRWLAQKNPKAHLPDVASVLNALAILDSGQHRVERARQELEEALQIYEDFAKRDPKQFSIFVSHVKELLEQLPR